MPGIPGTFNNKSQSQPSQSLSQSQPQSQTQTQIKNNNNTNENNNNSNPNLNPVLTILNSNSNVNGGNVNTLKSMLTSENNKERENKEEVKDKKEVIQMHKKLKTYYPPPSDDLSLKLLLQLRNDDESTPTERNTFRNRIAENLKNDEFKNYLNLNFLAKCAITNCKKKTPCKLIDADFINQYLISPICDSCGIEMTMWDQNKQIQNISCWNICAWNSDCCKTKVIGDLELKKKISTNTIDKDDSTDTNINSFDTKIQLAKVKKMYGFYCNGCTTLAEFCYFDRGVMNHYRFQLFYRSMEECKSKGYYYPRINNIFNVDSGPKYFDVAEMRTFGGGRTNLSKQWEKQKGFVTYKLPQGLAIEHQKDDDRYNFIQKFNAKNEEWYNGKYIDPSDPDIKEKTSTTTKKKPATITTSGGKKKKIATPAKKKLKVDSNNKNNSKESILDPTEYYDHRNNRDYVNFKIPIDPRKSLKKKKHLSTLSLTVADRNMGDLLISDSEIEMKDNYLFTTKLLLQMESRFEFEDFLRWGLDTFRIVTPNFEPIRSNQSESTHKMNDEDLKSLADIKSLYETTKEMEKKISSTREDISMTNKTREKIVESIRTKIIGSWESPESQRILENYNLVAKMNERKVSKVKMSKEFIISKLSSLLMKYTTVCSSLDKNGDDEDHDEDDHDQDNEDQDDKIEKNKKLFEKECIDVVNRLFQLAPVTKLTSFSLKYIDLEDDEDDESTAEAEGGEEAKKQK